MIEKDCQPADPINREADIVNNQDMRSSTPPNAPFRGMGGLIRLWRDGLRSMTWGKPLWILNIIKLLIMFGVLKLFFFPNFLKEKSDSEEGRRDYVANELVQRSVVSEDRTLELK